MPKIILFSLLLLKVSFLKAAFLPNNEKFNSSLKRLDSFEKINRYVDSCAKAQNIALYSKNEVLLVNKLVEEKFYHGYSHYSVKENWLAFLAGNLIWDHLSAIVIPEDLIDHPMAACSQQAIVMMEILKQRGYQVRKLGLVGHFVLEVKIGKNWYFFDPDKEIYKQGIPHDSLPIYLANGYLSANYSKVLTPNAFKKMFSQMQAGKVNEFPAKNAGLFHSATKFISNYFIPIFLISIIGAFFVVRNIRKNKAKRFNQLNSSQEKPAINNRCLVS